VTSNCMNRVALILIAGLMVIAGCRSKKELVDGREVRVLNYEKLSAKMEERVEAMDYYSSRVNGRFDDGKLKTNFTAKVRMKKDSVIWMSVSVALGIEVARVMLTPDSIMMINRLQKNYFTGGYDYLSTTLGVPVSYEMAQAIFTGEPYYPVDKKMKLSLESDSYQMKNNPGPTEIQKTVFIQPFLYYVTQQSYIDPVSTRALHAENQSSTITDDLVWVNKMALTFVDGAANSTVSLEMQVNAIKTESNLSFPFSIPDKFDRVE